MYHLPKPDERTMVVGSTGSGKTTLAAWLLASANWHQMPWTIYDYKRDKLLSSIVEIAGTPISIYDKPPTKPGLYVAHLVPEMDDDAVTNYMWKVWQNERHGSFIDEAFRMPKTPAVNAVFTQGRSKKLQVIAQSQRPVFLPLYYFSEANHFYVMRLQMLRDRQKVSEYLDGTPIDRLPKFHSLWYHADEQEHRHLAPVPREGEILKLFDQRMERKKVVGI